MAAKNSMNVGSPNQTLYCTNLPDKLKKPDLRTALYALFSTYGTVLDVVAMRTSKMRGQAHIVYRDIPTSTQAMRALQGFEFFGKEMKIVYAKGNSSIIARLRGTYNAPTVDSGLSTDLQKSIFNAPPSGAVSTIPPAKAANGPHGTKRTREEDESEGEAPMDEESDVSMEASSDED